jgi:hypothetical protein
MRTVFRCFGSGWHVAGDGVLRRAGPTNLQNEWESGIVGRENSLMRHGRGDSLGVFRLYLSPSSFGVAQDDRERHKRAIPMPNRIATSFFLPDG